MIDPTFELPPFALYILALFAISYLPKGHFQVLAITEAGDFDNVHTRTAKARCKTSKNTKRTPGDFY